MTPKQVNAFNCQLYFGKIFTKFGLISLYNICHKKNVFKPYVHSLKFKISYLMIITVVTRCILLTR